MTRRQGMIPGLVFALVASLAVGAIYAVVGPVLGSGLVLRVLMAAVGLSYLLFILREARQRVGRVTAVGCWAAAVGAMALFDVPIGLQLLGHVGLIWLIRSMIRYRSLVPAGIDLGLSGLALAGALWAAMETHSVALSCWTFLLVQSLYVRIPRSIGRRQSVHTANEDRFQAACRSAEAALRRLHA